MSETTDLPSEVVADTIQHGAAWAKAKEIASLLRPDAMRIAGQLAAVTLLATGGPLDEKQASAVCKTAWALAYSCDQYEEGFVEAIAKFIQEDESNG